MIQLNLLPDIKLEYIKAQRSRRFVLSTAILIAGVAIALLILLLAVSGLQKKHINDLSKDISSETSELQHKPQINKILTVQNQLQSLTSLHAQDPAAARLFNFLNEATPSNVSITNLKIDFTAQTMTITGVSDSLVNVNKYIDTLKLTTFTSGDNSSSQKAFSNVVLSSFSLDTSASTKGQAVNYTVTLNYDPVIFDATDDVELSVPNGTTTRAEDSQAADLFQAAPRGGR